MALAANELCGELSRIAVGTATAAAYIGEPMTSVQKVLNSALGS